MKVDECTENLNTFFLTDNILMIANVTPALTIELYHIDFTKLGSSSQKAQMSKLISITNKRIDYKKQYNLKAYLSHD